MEVQSGCATHLPAEGFIVRYRESTLSPFLYIIQEHHDAKVSADNKNYY